MLIDLKRFEDYKQEVILAYEKKKNAGTLPPNLQRPTAANLRKECLYVFHNRYSEKDSETFKAFCGERNNAGDYFQKLRALDADKFKPLNNFLQGITADTKNNNIELLAWLIDYEARPCGYVDVYAIVKSEQDVDINKEKQEEEIIEVTDGSDETDPEDLVISNTKSDERNTEGLVISTSEPNRNNCDDSVKAADQSNESNSEDSSINFGIPRKFNKAVLSFFAALIILCGSYIFYDQSKHQCMYWDGDQYQSVACDQRVVGAAVIPMDNSRLTNLKRIKDITTITINDIDKVHYSKVGGKVVFYTTGGENPNDRRKRLLPMTEYMYREYIEGH